MSHSGDAIEGGELERTADDTNGAEALEGQQSECPSDELSFMTSEYWKGVFWPLLEDPRDEDNSIGWLYICLNGFQQMLLTLPSHTFMPILVFSQAGILREEDGDIDEQMDFLLSSSIFMAGIATLFQTFQLGPIGCRLLIIMGNSYAFLAVSIMSGNFGGPALIFGMAMASAPFEILVAYLPRNVVRYFFPPIVTGTVIALIGCTVVGNFVGGWAGDGSRESMGLGFFTLGLLTLLLRWGSPLVKNSAFVIAIFVAFALAGILGVVDRTNMDNASWFTYPHPLKYGLKFEASHYLAWIISVLISTVESYGDIAKTCELSGKPTDGPVFTNRVRGGLNGDAFGSFVSGFFCTFPNTTYSSAQGVIKITGVSDRRVGVAAGVIYIILGFFGKFAGFLRINSSTIMNSILLTILMLLMALGFELIAKDDLNKQRTQFIVAISLGIGIGTHVQTAPMVASYLGYNSGLTPTANVIMSNGLAFGSIAVIILNLVLPKEERTLTDDWRTLRDWVLSRARRGKRSRSSSLQSVKIDELNRGPDLQDSDGLEKVV